MIFCVFFAPFEATRLTLPRGCRPGRGGEGVRRTHGSAHGRGPPTGFPVGSAPGVGRRRGLAGGR
jgi:hypothetical protein